MRGPRPAAVMWAATLTKSTTCPRAGRQGAPRQRPERRLSWSRVNGWVLIQQSVLKPTRSAEPPMAGVASGSGRAHRSARRHAGRLLSVAGDHQGARMGSHSRRRSVDRGWPGPRLIHRLVRPQSGAVSTWSANGSLKKCAPLRNADTAPRETRDAVWNRLSVSPAGAAETPPARPGTADGRNRVR